MLLISGCDVAVAARDRPADYVAGYRLAQLIVPFKLTPEYAAYARTLT